MCGIDSAMQGSCMHRTEPRARATVRGRDTRRGSLLDIRAVSSRLGTMHVLLVRHGTATSPDFAPTDEMRWLTDTGRLGVREIGRTLVGMGLRFSRMYTSPLVRAVQTAEILAA